MYFRSRTVALLGVFAFSLLCAACEREAAAPAAVQSPVTSAEVRPRVSGMIDRISLQEGARVKRGQILFRIDPRPFRAETERQYIARGQALSEIALAKANRARAQRLVGNAPLPPAETARLADDERVAAAHLAQATAALNAAKRNLELTEIRAPIDGRASRALVSQGESVSSDSLLTVIADAPNATPPATLSLNQPQGK